jgi:hypothetical protein
VHAIFAKYSFECAHKYLLILLTVEKIRSFTSKNKDEWDRRSLAYLCDKVAENDLK